MRIDELVENVKGQCSKISRTKQGILLQPKPEVTGAKLLQLHQKLTEAGAEYSSTANTYHFPPIIIESKIPEKLEDIPLQDLIPGPNPRIKMEVLTLKELYEDIKENGLRQRLEVRPSKKVKGKYEIIDGNRRKKVLEMLGWGTAPCRIKDMTDQEAYEAAFSINYQRDELTSLEQGRWFKIMMETFPETYPTQEALAKRVGVNQSTVTRHIAYYEAETQAANIMPRGIMEKTAPTREEESPVTHTTDDTTDVTSVTEVTPAAFHQTVVSERVSRIIRSAAPEFQDQLRTEALEKGYTVLMTKERAEELALEKENHVLEELIKKAPEEFHPYLRNIVREDRKLGRNPVESVKKIVSDLNIKNVDPKKVLAALQESAAKDYKKEKAKEKVLVKVLSEGYPETKRLLSIVVERFGRQKPDVTARLLFKLADQAVQSLSPEKLEEILTDIETQVN